MTNTLEDFGYRVTSNAQERRPFLRKAARRLGAEKVKKRLQSRKYRATGYKTRRYKADISFIEEEMNKRNDFELGLDLGLGL